METAKFGLPGLGRLAGLQKDCKHAIGKAVPTAEVLSRLHRAIAQGQIEFFVARGEDGPLALCPAVKVSSAFHGGARGVFEGF